MRVHFPELSDIGEGMAGRSVLSFILLWESGIANEIGRFYLLSQARVGDSIGWGVFWLLFSTDLYPFSFVLADNVHGRQGVAWHVAGRGESSARRRLGGSCTERVGHWHYYGYTIDMLDASQEIFTHMLSARRCPWIDGQWRHRAMSDAQLRPHKPNHVGLLDSGLWTLLLNLV